MNEPQKRAVTIFTILLTLAPVPFIVHYPNSSNLHLIALYYSAVIGYMGVVLLLWMYILGTRSVTGMLYTDIAPVLSIHKWLGKYATPMIFLHPILITYSKGQEWFYSLVPKTGTLIDRHILLGQISIAILALTWFVSAYLREKIGFRPWKYLHYLAYISVPFALLHIPDLGSQEQAYILVKAYLLLLGIIFIIFTFIRVRSLLNIDRVQYVISSNVQLTDIDRQLVVRPLNAPLKDPMHGQFVYIKLGYLSEDHPFSVTSFDPETQEIVLTYRAAGMYTRELAKLTADSIVYMSGPFGTFTEDLTLNHTKPVVYITGGIGITPFVSRIVAEAELREQWLFAANRNKATAVLSTTLKNLLKDRHIAIYNRENGPLGDHEESGYITAAMLTKYLQDPTRYKFYLCGPVPMMNAVRDELAILGVKKKDIHSEKFGW